MMQVQVKLFAGAKQLIDSDTVVVDLPADATIQTLRTELLRMHPQLEPLLQRAMFAVDTEYAGNDRTLDPNCEVAMIPPVSGG